MQLLKDGVLYAAETLNSSNGWQCEWPGLNDRYQWSVKVPDVPAFYDVSIEQVGITFVVTFTYAGDGDYGELPPL